MNTNERATVALSAHKEYGWEVRGARRPYEVQFMKDIPALSAQPVLVRVFFTVRDAIDEAEIIVGGQPYRLKGTGAWLSTVLQVLEHPVTTSGKYW